MSRPSIKPEDRRSVTRYVRVKPATAAKIDMLAAARGITPSTWLRDAIAEKIQAAEGTHTKITPPYPTVTLRPMTPAEEKIEAAHDPDPVPESHRHRRDKVVRTIVEYGREVKIWGCATCGAELR